MIINTTMEYRSTDIETFKGTDGSDHELIIYSFLDENDIKFKLTAAPDGTPYRAQTLDFAQLRRGFMYSLTLCTDRLASKSDNKLATTYECKYRILDVRPAEDKLSSSPFDKKSDKGGAVK